MKKQLNIKQARDKLAALIAKGEKQYLPIFIRLDKEYQKQQEQEDYFKKALRLHNSAAY